MRLLFTGNTCVRLLLYCCLFVTLLFFIALGYAEEIKKEKEEEEVKATSTITQTPVYIYMSSYINLKLIYVTFQLYYKYMHLWM